MLPAQHLTSPVQTCPDRWKTDALGSERMDDPRLHQIAKAQQNSVVFIDRVLRLPQRPLANHFVLSHSMFGTEKPTPQRLGAHADHPRCLRRCIDANPECGCCYGQPHMRMMTAASSANWPACLGRARRDNRRQEHVAFLRADGGGLAPPSTRRTFQIRPRRTRRPHAAWRDFACSNRWLCRSPHADLLSLTVASLRQGIRMPQAVPPPHHAHGQV